MKDVKLDKAIEVFLESYNLVPNLSDLYLQLKYYKKAEYYVDLLLNINKKNIEANNIKFISLVKQNKKEEADEFLENNEILKNQQNYIELKSLIHPEILAKINEQNNNNEIIELNNNKIDSYKLNYNKLLKLRKNNFNRK